MKLFFYPDYSSTNPYQKLLYSQFDTSCSVSAGTVDDAINFQRNHPNSKVVFHLHWQNVVTGPAENSHEHRLLARQFIAKLKELRFLGGTVAWTIHNTFPHSTLYLKAEREFHNQLSNEADAIFLHDRIALEIIQREYVVDENKVFITPHGNYIGTYPNESGKSQARKTLGISHSDFVIGFVGQLRPYKGTDDFIDAALDVCSRYEKVSALIAGKPVWPYKLGQVSQKASPCPKIRTFEELVPDEELQLYLNSSDIVLLPYKSILTSGSVMLAASFGKPVIIPELDSFKALVEESFVISYNPDESNGLIKAVDEAINLSPSQIQIMSESALDYAKSHDWREISRGLLKLFEHITDTPKTSLVCSYEKYKHSVDIWNHTTSSEDFEIAICVVNYFSFDLLQELYKSIEKSTQASWRMYVLDNSDNQQEFGRLRSNWRNVVLIRPESNLGYAAGNNILANIAKSDGCKKIAILNPDVVMDEGDVISKMIAEINNEPLAIHAPVITLGDQENRVSFFTATLDASSKVFNLNCLYQFQSISEIPQGVHKSDVLNGCALFFSTQVLDEFGYLPENYFLYFEETDWTLSLKKAGAKLLVHSDISVIHKKISQKGGLPTVPYTYYFLKNALIFASKFGFDLAGTEKKYREDFVEPWIVNIRNRAPEYLHCFQTLCEIAFQDGHKKVTGNVDIFKKVANFNKTKDLSDGYIEGWSDHFIYGWAGIKNRSGARQARLISFHGGTFAGAINANTAREDIKGLGYLEQAGFKIKMDKGFRPEFSALEIINQDTLKPLGKVEGYKERLRESAKYIHDLEIVYPEIIGSIDSCRNGVLSGWCIDNNHLDMKLEIDVVSDDRVLATGEANKYREDLYEFGGDGCYAFAIYLNPKYLNRKKRHFEIRLRGSQKTIAEKKLEIDIPANGYDTKADLKDFLKWSYVHGATPYGYIAKSHNLLKACEASKQRLVSEARLKTQNKGPLISVVMPAFNRGDLIEFAVKSVINQTYINFELIIVDDGSTDDTCQVIQTLIAKYSDHHIALIESKENKGVSHARNLALKEAKGEIITYLDSDNEWDSHYLELVNSAFYENESLECAYAGQEIWFHDSQTGREFRTAIRLLPFNRSKLELDNYIDLNVFSHRRSLADNLGGFREDIRRLVDWELIMRYTENKPPELIPALLNKYYFGLAANQITASVPYEENLQKLLQRQEF